MMNDATKGGISMVGYIAEQIKNAKDKGGTEAGKTMYEAWFKGKSRQRLYGRYQEDVDTILAIDGYADCIVVFD